MITVKYVFDINQAYDLVRFLDKFSRNTHPYTSYKIKFVGSRAFVRVTVQRMVMLGEFQRRIEHLKHVSFKMTEIESVANDSYGKLE